ncbi:hypothetical protein Y032_0605g565 [Ancylostoma ceylanicum]|uniref:Uncharacterized protein n=1 Tax=Ancylostoma ceylanicum TaxID=53326 RepID=A0A016WLA8_9BILA|nr:hypothetical protein Y032_0605g565 [Ancylostoma ceylanicum]
MLQALSLESPSLSLPSPLLIEVIVLICAALRFAAPLSASSSAIVAAIRSQDPEFCRGRVTAVVLLTAVGYPSNSIFREHPACFQARLSCRCHVIAFRL